MGRRGCGSSVVEANQNCVSWTRSVRDDPGSEHRVWRCRRQFQPPRPQRRSCNGGSPVVGNVSSIHTRRVRLSRPLRWRAAVAAAFVPSRRFPRSNRWQAWSVTSSLLGGHGPILRAWPLPNWSGAGPGSRDRLPRRRSRPTHRRCPWRRLLPLIDRWAQRPRFYCPAVDLPGRTHAPERERSSGSGPCPGSPARGPGRTRPGRLKRSAVMPTNPWYVGRVRRQRRTAR